MEFSKEETMALEMHGRGERMSVILAATGLPKSTLLYVLTAADAAPLRGQRGAVLAGDPHGARETFDTMMARLKAQDEIITEQQRHIAKLEKRLARVTRS
jgi:hypothetical protein